MKLEIRILGAHNIESAGAGFSSFLIDGVLAVDAGNLSSSLTFAEQKKIKAILLTHPHYDHLRDIPAIGMSMYMMKTAFDIYAPIPVRDVLMSSLINGDSYPDFTKRPENEPTIRMHPVEPGKKETVDGYEVLPVPVIHAVPAMGYQITSPKGKKVFFTSDTGPGLADEVAMNLFKPFITTKSNGMGLGLPLCRSIIEAHQGQISASSQPGLGTCFQLILPACAEDKSQLAA